MPATSAPSRIWTKATATSAVPQAISVSLRWRRACRSSASGRPRRSTNQAIRPSNSEGEAEVDGEAVGGDRDPCPAARPEATIHQPIAPCRPAEGAEGEEARRPARRDAAADGEPQEAERPDERRWSAELAVAPLPPVDALELVEGHSLVQRGVLRGSPCTCRTRPVQAAVAGRRHRAGDRAPLGDREAGVGEAGHAADQIIADEEREEDREPDARSAAVGGRLARTGAGPAARRGVVRPPPRRCCGSWPWVPPAAAIYAPARGAASGFVRTARRRGARRRWRS